MSKDHPGPTRPGSAWSYDQNAPAEAGPGLSGRMQSPRGETLFVGRVSDVYTNSSSCTVQIPNRTAGAGLTCIWLGASINKWGGTAIFHPPEVGSNVLVYEMAGQDIGLILGQVPALSTNPDKDKVQRLFGDGEVDSFGEDNAQVPESLGTTGQAVNAFQGMPLDAIPGDWGALSEFGAGLYCLRFMAGLKASELAKVEAFVLDDMLRITGEQLEIFTATGEERTYNDHGRVSTEESFGVSGREVDGLIGEGAELDEFPDPDDEGSAGKRATLERQTGRWRGKLFKGHLGDLINLFVCIPRDKGDPLGKATLDNPEDPENRDLGLAQVHVDTDGRISFRSVAGMGMVKPRAIAVPKKRHEAADPAGDMEPSRAKPADFQFSNQNSTPQQVRDYLAYMAASHTPANMLQQPLDWDMPDESSSEESGCPQIDKDSKGGNEGVGGHLRDHPVGVEGSDLDPDELKGRIFYVNDAYVIILPNGSVVIRSGWGDQITMNRGHIDISSSKDVNITAGRNINMMAGNDVNISGRKSVDVIAAHGQARLVGGQDVEIASRDGGILLCTDTPGGKLEEGKLGEEQHIPGIILKSEGEVVVSAPVARFDLSHYMYVRPRGGVEENYGNYPEFVGAFGSMAFDIPNGSVAFRFDEENYVNLGGGYSMWASGSVHIEGSIEAYLGNLTVQGLQCYNMSANSIVTKEFSDSGPGTRPAPPSARESPSNRSWESLIDGLSPTYTNRRVTGEVSKRRRNAARARVGLKADNSKVIGGTPFDASLLWANLDPQVLSNLVFSFRTEYDYGTKDVEDFAIFEQPWQREWGETVEWGRGAENLANKTAQYPGWQHWEGDVESFVRYEETNVEADGTAKPRKDISETGGEVKRTGLRSMPRHP